MSEVKPSLPPKSRSIPPKNMAPTWRHVAVDVVAMLVIGAAMILDKIDGAWGIALIALIVGARLPSKGGGVATLLLPVVGLLRSRIFKFPFFGLVLVSAFSCGVLIKPANTLNELVEKSNQLLGDVEQICTDAIENQTLCVAAHKAHDSFVDAWTLARDAIELAAALEETGSDKAPDASADALLKTRRAMVAWQAFETIALKILSPRVEETDGGMVSETG